MKLHVLYFAARASAWGAPKSGLMFRATWLTLRN